MGASFPAPGLRRRLALRLRAEPTAVAGFTVCAPVSRDLGFALHGEFDQWHLPMVAASKLDELVSDRRSLATAAAELRPRAQFRHVVDDHFEPGQLAVPVAQRDTILRGLQAAQHIGSLVELHSMQKGL